MPRQTRLRIASPRAGAIALSVLLAPSACHSPQRDPFDAAPPPALAASGLVVSGARASDDLWVRAAQGDGADLARLADREGAGGLLDGLEEGGVVGLTALAALPWASDAELAYSRLAEILRQVDPSASTPLIATIRAIAQGAPRQVEPTDPEGMRACAEALLTIARDTKLSPLVRAPAISAARLFVERRALDAKSIPGDLDLR